MTEQMTRYRRTWKNGEGQSCNTVSWRSTEAEAEQDFNKMVQWAKDGGFDEQYNEVAVETKTVAIADWPNNGTVTVYLEEEYGYRYWLWHTGMQAFELVKWWTNLQSVMDFFHTPVGLPGKVIPCEWGDDVIDSFDPAKPFGEDEEGQWFGTEISYRRPTESRNAWRVHLHCDDDSILMRGFAEDRQHFKHAGFDSTTLEELESEDGSNG